MSDEATAMGPRAALPIHVNHYCEHPDCDGKTFGSWGFEREGKRVEWRCFSHRDLEYRSKAG